MRNLTKHLLTTSLALLAAGITESRAEFALNWQPSATPISNEGRISCERPDVSIRCGRGFSNNAAGDPDLTPFLQETVTEGGLTYWHVIIGLSGTDTFAQEVYIRQQPGTDCGFGFGGGGGGGGGMGGGGGGGVLCSYSAGLLGDSGGFGTSLQTTSGNGWDPLRTDKNFTGNDSGDPTKMIMRQVINDTANGLTQEFLKAFYAFKPKISQTISDANFTSTFIQDMSNSDYLASTAADNNNRGIITNKVTLTGAYAAVRGNFDNTAANFSFDTANGTGSNARQVNTGGRYTFLPGTGWNATSTVFTEGVYTYNEGERVDISTIDWNSFRNPADNVLSFGGGGHFGGVGTPGTRKRGGNICKSGTATTPPVGC